MQDLEIEEQVQEERIITDFPNYSISDQGVVKNVLTGKILKAGIDKDEYFRIELRNQKDIKKFFVHRLVCEAFIENVNNLEQVDHKNGIKQDNRIQNLRWCSRKQNQKNRNGTNNELFIFVNELPEDCVEIEFYSKHYLEDYYYSPELNKMYYNNGVRIRQLISRWGNNCLSYICKDIDNKNIKISLTRLQKGLFNNE